MLSLLIFLPELSNFYKKTWTPQIQNSSFIWHILRFSSGVPFFIFESFLPADFVMSGMVVSTSREIIPSTFQYQTGLRYASTFKTTITNKGEISKRLFDIVQLSLKTQFLKDFSQGDLNLLKQNKKWLGLNTKFNNSFLETKNDRAQLPLHLIAFSRFMPHLDLSVVQSNPIFFEENILIYNPVDFNNMLKLNAAFSILEKNPSRVLLLPLGTESWRFYRGSDFIDLLDDEINVIKLYLTLNEKFLPQYNDAFSALQIKASDGIFFSKEDTLSIKRIEAKTIYADRKSTSYNSIIDEKGKFYSVLDFKTKCLILREGSLIKPPPINLQTKPIQLSEVETFVSNIYGVSHDENSQLLFAKNATISILKTEINNLMVLKK